MYPDWMRAIPASLRPPLEIGSLTVPIEAKSRRLRLELCRAAKARKNFTIVRGEYGGRLGASCGHQKIQLPQLCLLRHLQAFEKCDHIAKVPPTPACIKAVRHR